jgi:hypothetical protein
VLGVWVSCKPASDFFLIVVLGDRFAHYFSFFCSVVVLFFSAVEAASDRICIETKGANQAHLSAQDMLACCWSCGFGCDGGNPGAAWQWLKTTGIVTGGNYGDFSWCSSYSMPNWYARTHTSLNTTHTRSLFFFFFVFFFQLLSSQGASISPDNELPTCWNRLIG